MTRAETPKRAVSQIPAIHRSRGTSGPPGPADPRSAPFLGHRGEVSERLREWDVDTAAEVPELRGNQYGFTVLPEGALIVDDDCDEDLSRLADAVERELAPPYRAFAARSDERWWMVSARGLTVLELSLDGEEIELTSVDGERQFIIDGSETDPSAAPSTLVELGEQRGDDYVVQAQRLDENLWEVIPSSL